MTRSSSASRTRALVQLTRSESLTPSRSGENERDAASVALVPIAAGPSGPRPSFAMTGRTVVVFGPGAALTKRVVAFRAATQAFFVTDPTIPHSRTGPLT